MTKVRKKRTDVEQYVPVSLVDKHSDWATEKMDGGQRKAREKHKNVFDVCEREQ